MPEPSTTWHATQTFGLLSSQVGYDTGQAKHAIVRATDRDALAADTRWQLFDHGGNAAATGVAAPWGELWQSHWWVIDFSNVDTPGRYTLQLTRAAGDKVQSDPIDIGPDLLWDRALTCVALEHLERRAIFAKAKCGWMDAGAPWQEANAHGSMLTGLLDILDRAGQRLSEDQCTRLIAQVHNGCAYLALLQDMARDRGLSDGGISHMTPRFEEDVIGPDASKAAVAWAMAARVLPGDARDYAQRAKAALGFCLSHEPDNTIGFETHQRGLPDRYEPPRHQAATRELLAHAWACVELVRLGETDYVEQATLLIDAALARQAREDEAIDGLHGFFFEFDDRHHAEPAWAHQIKGRPIGVDAGATYPQWVLPVIAFLKALPDHPFAGRYRDALERFTSGYLIPACQHSPFLIAPLMPHREHGLIFFAGPWHGMNCIYGLTAALALELNDLFPDPALRDIATGNLQWVAGLNAGITREALLGCTCFNADLPEHTALPASMIYGVGHRQAGGWTTMRGSVCNGFAVGKQFEFDVTVTAENDGPHQLTDEDWIPHSAGWLSGLARYI